MTYLPYQDLDVQEQRSHYKLWHYQELTAFLLPFAIWLHQEVSFECVEVPMLTKVTLGMAIIFVNSKMKSFYRIYFDLISFIHEISQGSILANLKLLSLFHRKRQVFSKILHGIFASKNCWWNVIELASFCQSNIFPFLKKTNLIKFKLANLQTQFSTSNHMVGVITPGI